MRWLWGIVSVVILVALIYLGAQAIISIGWIFGWGVVSVVVFLIMLKVITDIVGFTTIAFVVLILLLLEMTIW